MKRQDVEAILRNFEMRLQVKQKRGGDFNEYHPERVDGEAFYRNMREEEFAALPLTAKRRGKVAYTAAGKSYEKEFKDKETFPVFISIYELCQLKVE